MDEPPLIAMPNPLTPRGFLDHMRDASSAWIQQRTVALLVEGPDHALFQHGTAVLVAIADDVFLISAAHVLSTAQQEHLWINAVTTGPNLIPLAGVEINRTDDVHAVDFGFVLLPEATIRELAPFKKFVRLSEIDREPEPSEGWYAAFGYPIELNTQLPLVGPIPTTGIFYGTRLHDWTRPLKLEDFDRFLNIALEFAPDRSTDSRGAIASVPHPLGMSGCGLWRMYRLDSDPAGGLATKCDWREFSTRS